MASHQAGAPTGAEQSGASSAQPAQMEATQPRPPKAPTQAAFGTSGGAAFVIRDYASI